MADDYPDHFSGHADIYARYRPTYPDALYQKISQLMSDHRLAWDCATGSGQAARCLARYFERVVATDASQEQLDHASGPDNVEFRQAHAERSGLEDSSVDLVTVAAAVHWFRRDAFYEEVRRVIQPGGVVALWSYGWQLIVDQGPIDALLHRLSYDILGDYWAPELHHTKTRYEELAFPFDEIPFEAMNATADWSVDDILGHMRTWSGAKAYEKAQGEDPVTQIEADLRSTWGERSRIVEWPLFFKIGRLSG